MIVACAGAIVVSILGITGSLVYSLCEMTRSADRAIEARGECERRRR